MRNITEQLTGQAVPNWQQWSLLFEYIPKMGDQVFCVAEFLPKAFFHML